MQSHKKPWLDPSTSFHYKRKANNRFLIFLKLFWGQDWLQQNEKMSIESQTRLRSWYWKRKPTWRKDLITYNNHSRIMFLFNWLDIIWRLGEGSFEIWRPRSRGLKNFGRSWIREVGGLENLSVFMKVICLSSQI